MSGGQVYRLYDAWANPLYYGSSRSVFGRLHTHTHRAWYPAVSMILVDWYPSRLIALAVERELILLGIRPSRFRVGRVQMRGYRREQLVAPLMARVSQDPGRLSVTLGVSQDLPDCASRLGVTARAPVDNRPPDV